MKFLLSCFLYLAALQVTAQVAQTYEGPFENGEATYNYVENNLHQKVFQGAFKYTQMIEIPGREGEVSVLMTGNYKEDKKHLAWGVTLKPASLTGITETITGQFIEGKKNGMWNHRLTNGETGEDMRFSQVTFFQNTFRGQFKYTYNNPEATDLKSVNVAGGFDAKGKMDGEWRIAYTDGTDQSFEDVIKFQHGVIALRTLTNMSTGQVAEQIDNDALVTAFFQNIDRKDSFSIVDGEKYGIRHKRTEHRILKPLFEVWLEVITPKLGNQYNSSLPTLIIRRGEIAKKNPLMNRMEIIPWIETPQGKREYEEQKRIDDSYNTKIGLADRQLELKNYQQALKLYTEATGIKKEETYPKEQMKVVQDLIAQEKRRTELSQLIDSRETLWKGNEKMLEAEDYYNKKKHLFEASQMGLDYLKKEMYRVHRDTRTAVERKAYETVSNEDLEAYLKSLEEIIAVQDKIKSLTKLDDTKDLEKELKKLDSGQAIVNLLMQ